MLVMSSEFNELMDLCDRILVLYKVEKLQERFLQKKLQMKNYCHCHWEVKLWRKNKSKEGWTLQNY